MIGLGLSINKARKVSGEFTPTAISNLELWLESDRGITLNGSNVAAWADQSGKGYNLTQATTSSQPLYVTNTLNGNPVIRFDGNNDRLIGGTNFPIVGNTPRSFILVYKPNISTPDKISLGWGGATGAGNLFLPVHTASVNGVGFGNGRYGISNNLTTFQIMIYQIPTGATQISSLQMFRNGVPQTVGLLSGSNQTLNTISTPLEIGNYYLGADNAGFNGDIAAVVAYSKALSTDEKTQIEQYLSTKYGL